MDSDAACVVALGVAVAAQVAVVMAAPTFPDRRAWGIAIASGLLCVLLGTLPRGVGTDAPQPVRPSVVVAVAGMLGAAFAQPGWLRRLSIAFHLVGGVAVALLFVELVVGSPQYAVPTDDGERAVFAPTWHTPLTGVWIRRTM